LRKLRKRFAYSVFRQAAALRKQLDATRNTNSARISACIHAHRPKSSRMDKPDQFRELFRMQQALNERIGVKTDGMSEGEKTTSRSALERKVG